MYTLVLLSTHFLFLLLLIYIFIHRNLLPKFNHTMFINFAFSITNFNSAWNFLFHHSKSHNLKSHVPDNQKGIRIRRYEHEPGSEGAAPECAVCLSKIEEGDEIRELRCDHLFHRVCLDRWVGYDHETCPLCRGSLAPRRSITELGMEVLSFKFWSFSSRDRDSWWLR
ncbi:hypothetical protein CsSME_00037135 [Camellia sinensis var. sinensis]